MNTTTTEAQNAASKAASNAIEYVNEQYSAAVDSTKHRVEDNPVSSTLISFGAGFAIGVAIASVIGQSDSNRRSRFVDSVSDQVMNGLSGWVPKSFRS